MTTPTNSAPRTRRTGAPSASIMGGVIGTPHVVGLRGFVVQRRAAIGGVDWQGRRGPWTYPEPFDESLRVECGKFLMAASTGKADGEPVNAPIDQSLTLDASMSVEAVGRWMR
jgi:hypothetical protein